jgi:hypothetical protein
MARLVGVMSAPLVVAELQWGVVEAVEVKAMPQESDALTWKALR